MGWLGTVDLVQAVARRVGHRRDATLLLFASPSPTLKRSTCCHGQKEESSPQVRATLAKSLSTSANALGFPLGVSQRVTQAVVAPTVSAKSGG